MITRKRSYIVNKAIQRGDILQDNAMQLDNLIFFAFRAYGAVNLGGIRRVNTPIADFRGRIARSADTTRRLVSPATARSLI